MKTADIQALKPSVHNNYADATPNLAQSVTVAEFTRPDRYEAINVGVDIHFAELPQSIILGYICHILTEHRSSLLNDVVLPMKDPLARIELVHAFILAGVIDELGLLETSPSPHITTPLARDPRVPAVMALATTNLEKALSFIAGALFHHLSPFLNLAIQLRPHEAIEIITALHMSHCYTAPGVPDWNRPTRALLLMEYRTWADEWAIVTLNPNMPRNEIDALRKRLPVASPAAPQRPGRRPARRAKTPTLDEHVRNIRNGSSK